MDANLAWSSSGVDIEETRTFYTYYPLKDENGNELNIELTIRSDQDEQEKVDTIVYDGGQSYDPTGLIADYKNYGFQEFLVTRA